MSKFVLKSATPAEQLDWGRLSWISRPPETANEHLTVINVELAPQCGHTFHKHPRQEEVIYVINGSIEQWIDQEAKILGPGDAVYIDADVVHASFNVGDQDARLLAILGPCVGEMGYELVEVADQEPWSALR